MSLQSVEVLRQEHDAILAVLEKLEQAVALAESGVPVPADIFADIQEFMSIFVTQCHNHKEDGAVFSRLDDDLAGQVLASRLKDEHRAALQVDADFAAAVAAYVPGDISSAQRLAKATKRYADDLRQHITTETDELFPMMTRDLSGSDQVMVAEFDRVETEEIGDGVHERLHAMIDGLPARIAACQTTDTPSGSKVAATTQLPASTGLLPER